MQNLFAWNSGRQGGSVRIDAVHALSVAQVTWKSTKILISLMMMMNEERLLVLGLLATTT